MRMSDRCVRASIGTSSEDDRIIAAIELIFKNVVPARA
jgi:histidinol-phosphate/aromatic aminotransferase/cobyric acid decarboxylase-like protein